MGASGADHGHDAVPAKTTTPAPAAAPAAAAPTAEALLGGAGGALAGRAGATAAAPPPPPTPAQLLAIQRLAGNQAAMQAVQRQVVQRNGETKPTQPMTIAAPIKFNWGHRWDGKTVGPVKLVPRVEFELAAKPAVTTLAPGQSSTKAGGVQVGQAPPDAPKGTGVEAGVKIAPGGEVGVSTELKRELPGKWLGADWEVKESNEITNKGGKFGGFSIGPNWKIPGTEIKYSPSVEFTIARWEPGELPEVAVVSLTPAEFSIPLFEYTTASGVIVGLEGKVKLTGEAMPDPVKIAQYVLEAVGAEALVSIGALVLPAAMATIIILELKYAEESGADMGALSTTAMATVMHYASSYGAVMTGAEPTQGPGAPEAAAKAKADLEGLKAKFTHEPIVKEKAKEAALYGKVSAEAKPKAKEKAIEEYKKRHPWRTKVFGVPGPFIDLLDTKLNNVGNQRDEQWLGVRDDKGNITVK
jgi:hypothetical protein